MLLASAWSGGSASIRIVCSKPGRTFSNPPSSARASEQWITLTLLLIRSGSCWSADIGVWMGGTPASCISRSDSWTEQSCSSESRRASEMIPRFSSSMSPSGS
eukprot:scaffold125875_cov30-Tisochrysis_lutea.AAC.4